ncbi:hypothetical protein PMSD_20695 [Paenibacillus macquariensis subsp. defensor]|nr:hypothetical protein PMSD_20695 [Paenibacillus macquariensis subsp. defensor]
MKRVIFIPGIMGSNLYEGRRLLGETRRWFSMTNRSLNRLKLDPNKKDKIYAGSPLEFGYKLVGNISIEANVIYEPIIKMLKTFSSSDITVHPYGYDWRKDLEDVCSDLHNLLSNFKNDEIFIVAHSMGGLLSHTYCHWAQQLGELNNIKKVITLGTPWKGTPDALKVLKYGIKDKGYFFPNADTVLKASRTFPSIYQLLPSIEYCKEKDYLNVNGRAMRWKECMDYVEKLDGCNVQSIQNLNKKIYQSLMQPWPNEIEHYNVIGVNQGSVGKIRIGDNGHDNLEPVDGDGVVPLHSALPYSSFNSKSVVYAEASHQGLTIAPNVIEWVKSILEDGTPSNVKGILDTYNPRTDWSMEKIDCPVDVIVENEIDYINSPSEDITRHTIGEATYLIYNNPKQTTISVEAYDEGTTSIETINIVDNIITSVTKFPTIEADPSKRAIIKVSFDENKLPIAKVYLADENVDDSPLEVKGVSFDIPRSILFDPPKTKIILTSHNEDDQTIFDEKGIKLSFEVTENPKSKFLETLYKVNDGPLQSYASEKILTTENGLKYGKNVLEYFSVDVFGNKEKTHKKSIIIESNKPKISYKILLEPEKGVTIKIEEYYKGVMPYKFSYKTAEDGEVEQYNTPLLIKAYNSNELFVKAEDNNGKKSDWEYLNLDFAELSETVWNDEGFYGTISDIIDLLPSKEGNPYCLVGKTEKKIEEKIPKAARSVQIAFDNVEYTIVLLPKLELYLDYHSQIIKRNTENTKISFLIYDEEDNSLKDIEPSVKYTLIYSKNGNNDTYYPTVSSNNNGVYSFNIPVGHISKETKKIKIEFRDIPSRQNPLETRTFKLE